MNILWQQPSGQVAVTSIFDGSAPTAHAVALQSRGDVPADWVAVGFDVAEFPATPQETWRFANGQVVTDAAALTQLTRQAMMVTRRQIRQALTLAGLRAAVEAAVAAGSQDLKDWWDDAATFERLHPEVVAMGQAIGKAPEEVDAVFALAATL